MYTIITCLTVGPHCQMNLEIQTALFVLNGSCMKTILFIHN